jgi:hypothetical protein
MKKRSKNVHPEDGGRGERERERDDECKLG